MKSLFTAVKSKIVKQLQGEFHLDLTPEQFNKYMESRVDLTAIYKEIKFAINLDVASLELWKYGKRTNKTLVTKPQRDKLIQLGYKVTDSECGEKVVISGWGNYKELNSRIIAK